MYKIMQKYLTETSKLPKLQSSNLKNLQFWQQVRNTRPYKIFDYSIKIYFAQYQTPLKDFMDNPPNCTDTQKNTAVLGFFLFTITT